MTTETKVEIQDLEARAERLDVKKPILCQSSDCNGVSRTYHLLHTDFERGIAVYQCGSCPQVIHVKIPQPQMELYQLRKHEATIR